MVATSILDDTAIANALALKLSQGMFHLPQLPDDKIIERHYAQFVLAAANGLYNIAFSRGGVGMVTNIQGGTWPFLSEQQYKSNVAFIWRNSANTVRHAGLLSLGGIFRLKAIVLTHANLDLTDLTATSTTVRLSLIFGLSHSLDLPESFIQSGFAVLRIGPDGKHSTERHLADSSDELDCLSTVLHNFDGPKSGGWPLECTSLDDATGTSGITSSLLVNDAKVLQEYLMAVAYEW